MLRLQLLIRILRLLLETNNTILTKLCPSKKFERELLEVQIRSQFDIFGLSAFLIAAISKVI